MELHEKLTRLLFFLLVIVVILSALTYLILDTYIPITSPFSIDDAKKRIFTLNLVDSICRTLAAIYFYGNFTLLWFYIKSRKRISFSRQEGELRDLERGGTHSAPEGEDSREPGGKKASGDNL